MAHSALREKLRPSNLESSEGKRLGILVVDDDEIVREFCCIALQQCGYRTSTAMNAEECLRVLKSTEASIELVLLDIHMPGRSGLDILPEIRHRRPAVAVVVMSGDGDPSLGRAIQSGWINRVLVKPFTPVQLWSAVDGSLRELASVNA